MTTRGYEVSFKGDENVIKLDYGDGCTALNILKCIELYISFPQENVVVCKLCLNKAAKKSQSVHTKYPLRTTGLCAVYSLSQDSLPRSCKDPDYYTHSTVEETEAQRGLTGPQ